MRRLAVTRPWARVAVTSAVLAIAFAVIEGSAQAQSPQPNPAKVPAPSVSVSATEPDATAIRPTSYAFDAWVAATTLLFLGSYEFYRGYLNHRCQPGDVSTSAFTNCNDARANRDKYYAGITFVLSYIALSGTIRSATEPAIAKGGFEAEPVLVSNHGRPGLRLRVSLRW